MIYVDPLVDYGWKLGPSCHCYTDLELSELHAFAIKLGLRISWLDRTKFLPHYDLTVSKRKLALVLGAVEVDSRHPVRLMQLNREKGLYNNMGSV